MKKEVIDIQELHAELDAEDQELMQMFPPRQRVLDDMLMVTEDEDCYLVSKTWLAHKRKQREDAVRVIVTGSGILLAVLAAVCLFLKIGNPGGWWGVLSALGLIAGGLGLVRDIR